MKDHIIPESVCPYCGHIMDRSLNAKADQDAQPRQGDVSVCIQCAKIGIFDEERKVRKPTPEELERALKMPELTLAQMAIAHCTYDAPWNKKKEQDNEHTNT